MLVTGISLSHWLGLNPQPSPTALPPVLRQEADDLIDLLHFRLQQQPITTVAPTLKAPLYELRIKVLEWLLHRPSLAQRWHTTSPMAAIEVEWQLYQEIVNNAWQKNFGELLAAYETPPALPSYATLTLLLTHPSPHIHALKHWLDASLLWELALIATTLPTSQQLNDSRIYEEILPFLQQQLVQFGAYSIFTLFWTPAPTDTRALVNDMTILAATLELEHRPTAPISSTQLHSLMFS